MNTELGKVVSIPVTELKNGMLVYDTMRNQIDMIVSFTKYNGEGNYGQISGEKGVYDFGNLKQFVVVFPTDMAVRSASMGTMLTDTQPLKYSQWQSAKDDGLVDSDRTVEFETIKADPTVCIKPLYISSLIMYKKAEVDVVLPSAPKIHPTKQGVLDAITNIRQLLLDIPHEAGMSMNESNSYGRIRQISPEVEKSLSVIEAFVSNTAVGETLLEVLQQTRPDVVESLNELREGLNPLYDLYFSQTLSDITKDIRLSVPEYDERIGTVLIEDKETNYNWHVPHGKKPEFMRCIGLDKEEPITDWVFIGSFKRNDIIKLI